jgi:hypothetical protein
LFYIVLSSNSVSRVGLLPGNHDTTKISKQKT